MRAEGGATFEGTDGRRLGIPSGVDTAPSPARSDSAKGRSVSKTCQTHRDTPHHQPRGLKFKIDVKMC